jgi:hypothetical protein
VWEAIWADLHMELREELGREASPSAAIIDSQSLKSAEKGVNRHPIGTPDRHPKGTPPSYVLSD